MTRRARALSVPYTKWILFKGRARIGFTDPTLFNMSRLEFQGTEAIHVFVRPLSRLELHEWKGKCSGITCFKKNGFVQFVLSCATLGFDQRFRSQKWRKLSAGSTVLSTSLTRNSVSLPPLPVSSISDAYSLNNALTRT